MPIMYFCAEHAVKVRITYLSKFSIINNMHEPYYCTVAVYIITDRRCNG